MLKCFKCLLMVSLLSFYPCTSFAGSFEVAPTTLSLQAEARSGALHLTNQGNMPVTIQIEPFEWKQIDNKDILIPTEDLMVSPPLVKFPAGGKQTIRLAVNPELLEQEKSFRVILSELSTPDSANGQAIRVLLQFNVPVFIKPQQKNPSQLKWSFKKSNHGFTLTAENIGLVHVKLSNLVVTPSGQSNIEVTKKGFQYILPKSKYSWDIKSSTSAKTLNIKVDNEGEQSIDETITISE